MSNEAPKQPFISVSVFAILLIIALLYLQLRSDKSIGVMQTDNKLSIIAFNANDSLQQIITDINSIEGSLRKNIVENNAEKISKIKDTISILKKHVENVKLISASESNKVFHDSLASYISQKEVLYNTIFSKPGDAQIANSTLSSPANKLLSNSIYVAAENIQIKLDNDLHNSLQENAKGAAQIQKFSRILTISALIAILLLATLIIRHLFKNANLIMALETEKQKTIQAAKIKEQFLANMSHEIRTPINAITGFTNLLGKTTLDSQQNEFVYLIKTASVNLHSVINDILDISKLEAGMTQISNTTFNLKDFLADIELLFSHQSKQKNIKLISNIGADLPNVVIGDSEKLNQILLNLLSNALKFTPEQGTITITASLLDKNETKCNVNFSIKDSGIGIPQNKLKSIFERFEQADSETTRNYGGTGLGLAIVKKLVTIQGGDIVLESEEGKGSDFKVTIPFELATLSAEELKVKKDEMKTSTNITFKATIKILAAEDNQMNQLLLNYLFKQWNLDLTIAKNGSEALDYLKVNKYDLIFLDVQMPVMDGYTAVRKLRAELQLNTPVIAMTAHAMPGEKEKCIALGMNDYLPKPLIEEDLIAMLKKYLPDSLIEGENKTEQKTETTSFINIADLKATFDNNSVFIKELFGQFSIQFPDEVNNFRAAYDAKDYTKLKSVAHSLKTTVTVLNKQSSLISAITIIENSTEENYETEKFKNAIEKIVASKEKIIIEINTITTTLN